VARLLKKGETSQKRVRDKEESMVHIDAKKEKKNKGRGYYGCEKGNGDGLIGSDRVKWDHTEREELGPNRESSEGEK